MKRAVPLFLLIVIVVAAIVIALQVRLRPAAPPPQLKPDSLPVAPDMDTMPGDSLYFGSIARHRAQVDADWKGGESPLEDADRASFRGLKYFPVDPAYRLKVRLEPVARRDSVILLDTKGEQRVYEVYGVLRFALGGSPQRLTLFREPYHRYLFLPFRDTTTGKETYDVGRYVEPLDLGDGEFLIDFNLAYNPYCAYSHRWACPIPPEQNQLDVAVRAGEMKYHAD